MAATSPSRRARAQQAVASRALEPPTQAGKTAVDLLTRPKISVNLQPKVAAMLAELVASTQLRQTEVIQDAIKLLHFIKGEADAGRHIYSVNADGQDPKELVLL